MKFEPYEAYFIEGQKLNILESIKISLYSEKKLDGDDMRDMANQLDVILSNFIKL